MHIFCLISSHLSQISDFQSVLKNRFLKITVPSSPACQCLLLHSTYYIIGAHNLVMPVAFRWRPSRLSQHRDCQRACGHGLLKRYSFQISSSQICSFFKLMQLRTCLAGCPLCLPSFYNRFFFFFGLE